MPASFRAILSGQNSLYVLLSVDHPVAEAGGTGFMQSNQARLAQMDPLSPEYEYWSFVLEGEASELKIDGDGRIILTDNILAHTSITDSAVFFGRGHFFQIWQPENFDRYRQIVRENVRKMRRDMRGGDQPD